MYLRSCLFISAVLLTALSLKGQTKEIDLFRLAQTGGLTVQNRSIITFTEEGRKGIRFSAREGDGVAWLNGVRFSDGVVEFDIRGKDVLQQSFVGLAFHGETMDSLEAVYFRPFNFRASDSLRRSHAVEYVFSPDFPWERLRKEHPGIYEKGIAQPPVADRWFHVKIIVRFPEVSVYIDHHSAPSLQVHELNTHTDGKIGLWVGNNSDGDFANLTISDRSRSGNDD